MGRRNTRSTAYDRGKTENEPRVPKGMPTGGQWTSTGNPAVLKPRGKHIQNLFGVGTRPLGSGILERSIAAKKTGPIRKFVAKRGPWQRLRQRAVVRARKRVYPFK